MNRKDLDALNELYLSVYSGEQLNESYLEELTVAQKDTKIKSELNTANSEMIRRGGVAGSISRGLTSMFGSQKDIDKNKASDKASDARVRQAGAASVGKYYSSSDNKTYANYNDAKAARNSRLKDLAAKQPAAKPAAAPAAKPAAAPTTRPTAAPTTRPTASTSPGTPKVAPTKPTGSPMDQWRAANPKLAAAADEKARIRGTQQTDNPLMKDMRSKLPMNSPSVQSPAVAKLGAGNQSLVNNPNAIKAAPPKPAAPTPSPAPARNGFGASTAPIAAKSSVSSATAPAKPAKPAEAPKRETQLFSYQWPSAKTIREIAGAYSSIYEAKKKVDQDQDGDNDFADVRVARMIASGVPKAKAIAMVKDKSYNEEVELWVNELLEEGYDLSEYTWEDMFEIYLDEATRMRKELGKEGEIATRQELARRSNAYQRSGSVDRTIAAAERGAKNPYVVRGKNETEAEHNKREQAKSQTLTRLASNRRGSVRDKPRAGLRGYAAKVEGSDRDLQSARSSAMAAGTLTPREQKMLNKEAYEAYEFVASYLLENNFASTVDDANVIINNMSENWFNQIIEG